MEKIRCDAIRCSRWLIAAATAAFLAGCSGPYAWNEYLAPGYVADANRLILPSSVPSEVTGAVGGLSNEQLRSAVAQATQAPGIVQASGGTAQQGSSTPPDSATRTVWTFSSAPASSGPGTAVHVVATYYRDDAVVSVAEGDSVITSADDPRLRQLITYVADALTPQARNSGNGH
jgi:hypothetical protein